MVATIERGSILCIYKTLGEVIIRPCISSGASPVHIRICAAMPTHSKEPLLPSNELYVPCSGIKFYYTNSAGIKKI